MTDYDALTASVRQLRERIEAGEFGLWGDIRGAVSTGIQAGKKSLADARKAKASEKKIRQSIDQAVRDLKALKANVGKVPRSRLNNSNNRIIMLVSGNLRNRISELEYE